MRTLFLNLKANAKPSVAEQFLTFSPRVHYRDPGYIFADISATSHLFGGEEKLFDEALYLCKDFYPDAEITISNSPFSAQAFSSQLHHYISSPLEEDKEMRDLPLESLKHLEGLISWRSLREIEQIVSFFRILGMDKIEQIQNFQVESFRERWGDTGSTLWKRLHGMDKQVISLLLPSEALKDYVYLDYPISLVSFLIHCLERSLKSLFQRLRGRQEFARKIQLHLYCEYSDEYHLIELNPSSPSRNLELYLKLLENKLSELNLDNPIREFEIDVVTSPEKVQQLASAFNQASITTGFLQPKDEILPENSWELIPEFNNYEPLESVIELNSGTFKVKPSYGQSLRSSPRPTRVLEKPQPLNQKQVDRLHFLSHHPMERLEDSWWEESRGRDYYLALTSQGQCLWIFFDRIEESYYLHGYFD